MNGGEPISLDELWAQNAEMLLDRMVRELKAEGGPAYRRISVQVLQTRVQRLFDVFWQAVSQNDPKPMIDYIRSTGRKRGHEGFTVSELQNVALRLRDAMLEVVDQAYADDAERRLINSRRVEELILSGVGAGVQGYVDGREALIARQYRALRRQTDEQD
jgi:hypothetical protein